MWTIDESVSFDRPARLWVRREDRLVGAVNLGALRAYVFPFYTPNGRLVIQESPVDHPHHQGLTVGASLNGWDMWNAGSFGVPRSRQIVVEDQCSRAADQRGASFHLTLDWTTEPGAKVAREQRTISLSAAPYGNVVDVRMKLHASYGEIRFAQTKEAGLSMRVPPEWITLNGGTILDPQGRTGEGEIFDTAGEWIDVSGEGPGGVFAGITLMPHKDCPQVPWMTRDYGLHVYNPWRHSEITVPEGGAYELGVRYVAHDGKAAAQEIAGWFADCP